MSTRAEYDDPEFTPPPLAPEIREILGTECSEQFIHGMRMRLVASYFKYGPMANAYPHDIDALKSMVKRLKKYRATGNVEWLIDAANFLLIEYLHPRHPSAHFRPTDSHESPGRARDDGGDPHGAHGSGDKALDSLRARRLRDGD